MNCFKIAVVLASALAVLFSGCGKKNSPAPATPPTASEVAPGQQPVTGQLATPQIQPPGTPLTQADGAVDMPELQRTVIRWVVANRRRPNSFEDFAATAGVPIPPPPAGKKYTITHDLHVQLVNR
jgi:hypothetical protein